MEVRTIIAVEANCTTRSGFVRDVLVFSGLAGLVRVVFMLAIPRVLDSADAIHYITAVQQLASGSFLAVNPGIPILYPFLASPLHVIGLDVELACKLVSLVASTLLVVPAYGLTREMHGRGAARMAGLMIAFWPWLVDYASRIGPDALGCTLWLLSVWLFVRGMRRGGLCVWLAPLAFFGLHLARPEGTFLLLAAPLAGVVLCGGERRRDLMRLVPYVLVAAVLLAAYAAYMKTALGRSTVSYRAELAGQEFEFTYRAFRELVRTVLKTVFEVHPLMLGPVLMVFLGVGLFEGRRSQEEGVLPARDGRLELSVLFFAGVHWCLALAVVSPEPRYQMPLLVALSLWAARGAAAVSERAAGLRWGRWLRRMPAAAVVGTMVLGMSVSVAAVYLESPPPEPWEYKTAGEWMAEHVEPGLVFTRKPQIGYYAGMPTTGPARDESLQRTLERARVAGARYLVVDERYTAKMAPALAPLLDPERAPEGLRLLKVFAEYEGAKVVVYAFEPEGSGGGAP